MAYVDGFLLTILKKNLAAYRRMARLAGKVWREHGAIDYKECIGDDLKEKRGCGISFSRVAKVRPGEAIFFSYIVYKSRAHRDRVNAKVMKDPRLAASMKDKPMPFDMKRMAYGGFKVLVSA